MTPLSLSLNTNLISSTNSYICVGFFCYQASHLQYYSPYLCKDFGVFKNVKGEKIVKGWKLVVKDQKKEKVITFEIGGTVCEKKNLRACWRLKMWNLERFCTPAFRKLVTNKHFSIINGKFILVFAKSFNYFLIIINPWSLNFRLS